MFSLWMGRAQAWLRRPPRRWWLYAALAIASPWLLAAALWWSFLPFRVLFEADAMCIMGLR